MQISVAMCTYNGQRYLESQLTSIAAQSLLPNELVVCDDGSTDDTAEVIRGFSSHAPFPVRFIQNSDNLGSTKNFEKAISLCRGDLIALCDQDDEWMPEKLARLATVLSTDPAAGGVFSNAYLIDKASGSMGRLLWDEVPFSPETTTGDLAIDTLLRHNVVTGATLMFRSSLRSLLLPLEPHWVHDGWMAWMLVLYSRLVYLSEPLICYRMHASQQVGLPLNSSIWDRITRARQAGSEPQLLLAAQFEALRAFWIAHATDQYAFLADDLTKKIHHCYLRAGLPAGRLSRVMPIVRHVHSYRKFSLGWLTMAKDWLR